MSSAREPGPALAFVVPPLRGPISGGTLYNRELLEALAETAEVRVLGLDCDASAAADSPFVWVDSLFLGEVPRLRRTLRRPIALLLHYLPTFVALGRAVGRAELSAEEYTAIANADALWVPSAFMRDAIEPMLAPAQGLHVLEPGTRAQLRSPRGSSRTGMHALCVGNVTPGKGYLEWLTALGAALASSDRCDITIVGSLTADPSYAQKCLDVARATPLLAERVRFAGELAPDETLTELRRADLFVSASLMESYGMALAEAHTSGVPIVALDRGNARAHARAETGGNLAGNQRELAALVLQLARAPKLLLEREERARANAPNPRRWLDVAREFSAQLPKCEK